jgi:hypothetical protein
VAKIERIRFEKFPERVMYPMKMIRIQGNIYAFNKEREGVVYTTHRELLSNFYFTLGDYHWTKTALAAFVRLGILTDEEVAQHHEAVAQRVAQRDARYAAREIRKDAATAGIALSAEQTARLDELDPPPPHEDEED